MNEISRSRPASGRPRMPIVSTLLAACMILLGISPFAQAADQINWWVISGGGNPSSSGSFLLNGTVGQTAVGPASSASFKDFEGYWQNFAVASCCVVAGDANNDTHVNVGDAVFMINYVFKGGPPPPCKDQGDANHDCHLNVGDAVYLINYVFKAGPAPGCGCVGP